MTTKKATQKELPRFVLGLYRLVTGELIIGHLDLEMMQSNKTHDTDIFFIKNPASIIVTQDRIYLSKFNHFSRMDTIMVSGQHVMYVDVPNDTIIELYEELLGKKESTNKTKFEEDSDSTKHTLH